LSRSTATCLRAGARWAYLMVIWMLACPNRSATNPRRPVRVLRESSKSPRRCSRVVSP